MLTQFYPEGYEKDYNPNINLLFIYHTREDFINKFDECSQPFTKLIYILDGEGHFTFGNNRINYKPHDLLILSSENSSRKESHSSNLTEAITIGISGVNFISECSCDMFIYKGSYTEKNEIRFYFNKILKEVSNKFENYDVICKDLVMILVMEILRSSRNELSIYGSNDYNSTASPVKDYIDVNYTKDITLERLGDIAHINKYYLAHEFKRDTGTTPINYLINRRISAAKILLETTDHSIGNIASLVGFKSQSYFNQVFKNKLNITPSAYRKALDENENNNRN